MLFLESFVEKCFAVEMYFNNDSSKNINVLWAMYNKLGMITTFHIVSREPMAAGTNQTEFMIVISDGLSTN